MSKKIDPNLFDGNFIEEVSPLIQGRRKRRQVRLKCLICSNSFITSLDNAKRTRQKTCSNQCSGTYRENIEGGNENHPFYSRWLSMRDRCNNSNNTRYPRYGGRGITVYPIFDSFIEYVNCLIQLDNCPKDINNTNLQVDRKDNELGYYPDNLRWVSNATNGANKTHSQEYSTSKYRGIYFCNTHKRWIATVTHEGKKLLSSHHIDDIDALYARNLFITKNNLPHPIQQKSNV